MFYRRIGQIERSVISKKVRLIRNIDWWKDGYLLLFGIVVARDFMTTTMYDVNWLSRFSLAIYLLVPIYAGAKFLLHNTFTKKETVLVIIIGIAFSIAAYLSGYHFLWTLGWLIIGAKDVSVDNIMKVYAIITLIGMSLTVVTSLLGIVPNLIYEVDGRNRQALGIIYPTDCAAHIFYLTMIIACISNRVMKWWKIGVIILIDVLIYQVCGARTSTICLAIFIVMNIICLFYKQLFTKISKLIKALIYSPAIIALISIIFIILFDMRYPIWVKLDSILNSRLRLGAEAIQQYGVKLFGQFIEEAGFGGEILSPTTYFFIDNSYIRMLLEYGIVIFVLVVMMYIMIGKKALVEKRYILLITITIVAIQSFMEHHLIEVTYCPLIVLLFADFKIHKMKEQKR